MKYYISFFFFNLRNPSNLTMALGLTQPVTENSIRESFLGGKARPERKADYSDIPNVTVW
jgi:hypothetical protein